MSPLPLRMLANRVVLFSVFLPLISFSQVKIKEKVEVYPKAQSKVAEKSERQARTAAGSDRFFNPPLFVYNSIWNQTRLALPSTLTISGSITIGGDILGNQHTKLLDVGPWGQEHPIAWKGKAGWAGVPYSGESPYTGTFSAGSYPDVRLYLFDYKWTDGVRTMTFSENSLKYDFTGLLYQGHYTPPVPVTATATASGSILPEARFDRWQLGAPPMFVTGRDSARVSIAPLDGNGNWYGPWGISPADVEVTLRVDASGSHAYLAFMETRFDWDTEEFVVVQYKSGREITVPLAAGDGSWEHEIETFLVYNDSMGTFDGLTETVQITITGGGKSKTIPVVITKEVICAQVAFNPPKLAPGETATLEFRKEDGTAFDADVKFDVMILGGGTNPGKLQSSSGTGVILSKTRAPVTYVAPAAIDGDSLVVQVAAYAYTPVGGGGGGGGGDVSTVLAKVSPIQKKAPRQITKQSVTLNSDRVVLERIGKLLANNQCPSGKVVVKQKIALPWCDELPQPLTHFTSTRRDNGPGCDASDPTKLSYSEPDYAGLRLIVRICYDRTSKAARIDPYLVGGQIFYGICESSIVLSQKVLIRNGETVSEETSRFLRAELEYRLQAINAGAGPWYQKWLTEAELITHEERHLPQFELLLASAAANIKSKYTEALISAEEAGQIASNDRGKNELDDRIRGDFLLEFANLERQTHDDDEKDAALMQAETIKILMKQYGTSSQ